MEHNKALKLKVPCLGENKEEVSCYITRILKFDADEAKEYFANPKFLKDFVHKMFDHYATAFFKFDDLKDKIIKKLNISS